MTPARLVEIARLVQACPPEGSAMREIAIWTAQMACTVPELLEEIESLGTDLDTLGQHVARLDGLDATLRDFGIPRGGLRAHLEQLARERVMP